MGSVIGKFISLSLSFSTTNINPKSGKLRVKGNPSEHLGDINISLREKGSPVKIAPGTKDIVLIMPLDKEGIAGPSSVYVNVICDRRHSTDPVSVNKDFA